VNAGWLLCTMCHRPYGAGPMTSGGGRVKPNESPAASTPEPASPFPPAFRWDASPQEAPPQVVRPHEVRDLFQPASAPSHEPIKSPAQPIAGQPAAGQQSAGLRQGSEGFQTPTTRSRSRHIIGIMVLAVLVLGLVAATVAYFLTARSPDGPDNAQIALPLPAAPRDLPAPPASLPAPVDTADALIEPPGQPRGGGGPFDLDRLASTRLVPRPILTALQAGGMIDGVLKTTTAGDTTIGMFAFTMPDQRAATVVARKIAAVQYDGGLLVDNHRALQGVMVLHSAPGPLSTVYRTVYVLYNRAIYFEVFGPDRDAVLSTVDFLINQQVNHAPPTVSGG
jgi:hypothetical protein